jgi:cell division transport system permease protein
MRALKYAVGEALLSLWRAKRSALFSVATIAATLLIFGGFLVVSANLEPLIEGWNAAAELSAYLTDDVTEAQRRAIDQRLVSSSVVASREYVSKAEALDRFTSDFDDLSGAVAGFDDNPFPASFEVRLRTEGVGADAIDALAEDLTEMGGVADVRYDRVWLERLSAAGTLLRALVVAFAAVLLVGVSLTVSSVVRLAFYARRDEIEIMRLVGAPGIYVRGPFLVEGIVQGGIGAGVALALLWLGFVYAQDRYGELIVGVLGLGPLRFLPSLVVLQLLLGGMAVGCVGGLLATWGDASPAPPGSRAEPGGTRRVDRSTPSL